ncbi:MAG: SpoIIE family protein phosphatase [Reichenbachiella sp.]
MSTAPNTISSDFKALELNALLEVTQAINNNLPEESLYKIYHFTMLADLKVKRLALFVNYEDNWQAKVFFGVPKDFEENISLEKYLKLKTAIPVGRDKSESRYFDLAIPIQHKDRLLAIVLVGGIAEVGLGQWEKSSTNFLEALTNIILVAIENKKMAREQLAQEAYKKELEIAKQVQQFLFPKSLPENENLEIDAVYQPHQNVGGDYYDYIKIDEDKFLICIADVSGKGIPAALMMSNFQASLRTMISQSTDLNVVIQELNTQLNHSGNGEIFITFFVAIYDKKKQLMKYINCGHNPPILSKTKGEMELLEIGTTVLGMFDPLPFLQEGEVTKLANFDLFCYTDGLNEAINKKDEEFGEDRIEKIILAKQGQNPKLINESMLNGVIDFKGETPYRDDVTLLSIKVKS